MIFVVGAGSFFGAFKRDRRGSSTASGAPPFCWAARPAWPAGAAAAACARGWPTAVQPAVLAGTVGYVVGTPLACAVAAVLRGMTTT